MGGRKEEADTSFLASAQLSSKSTPNLESDQLEHVQCVCWAEAGRLGAWGLARHKEWRAEPQG